MKTRITAGLFIALVCLSSQAVRGQKLGVQPVPTCGRRQAAVFLGRVCELPHAAFLFYTPARE
jgi:hypothetical protein